MPTIARLPRWLQELSVMLRRYPDADLVVYIRVSCYKQAGKGMFKLVRKRDAVLEKVRELAPDRKVYRVFYVVERGQVSKRRRKLQEAAACAKDHGCILLADYRSRFIRAESGINDWPTPKEFDRLRKVTLGVPLATVEDPRLSLSKTHSLATRRTKMAGRKRTIDDNKARLIVAALGRRYKTRGNQFRWTNSLRKVAKKFHVSVPAIQRMLTRPSPNGILWKDVAIKQHLRR
jgi:DNA invertase Pin-like site-specific DNA recombinase